LDKLRYPKSSDRVGKTNQNLKIMKKIILIAFAVIGFGLSVNAQQQTVVSYDNSNELLAYNSTTAIGSDCNYGVFRSYDSYCKSYKITYTNTCDRRIQVKVSATWKPNEGYRGNAESFTKYFWLQSGYSNATLLDCNATGGYYDLDWDFVKYEDN
jgi:hypothetical protein